MSAVPASCAPPHPTSPPPGASGSETPFTGPSPPPGGDRENFPFTLALSPSGGEGIENGSLSLAGERGG